MMLKLNLQFFASKKGVGSTKNGRDSESKRLGAKNCKFNCNIMSISPLLLQ